MAALRSRIGAHLREWASSGSVDLGSLGREQLERLVPLLRQFDASPSEEVLRKAVAAPLAALGAVYTAAATRTLHGILNEDPHQILKGLLDMEAGYAPLRDVHSIILGDLRSSQDGLDLRRSQLANALRGLDEHDVMRAFSAARSPDSLALLDGLFEASSTVTAQGQDLVGNRLTTLGAYFEETSAQLADELDERARQTGATSMIPRDDTGRPIMPSSGERITADLLPPLARAALREVLGLESRPEGAPEFRFRNDV